MSSRQSSVATSVSQNGLQYAAPATYAVAQNDIFVSNETSNPANGGLQNGTGSNAVATQVIPILTSSGGNHGLTSVGTTATCNLGGPHGFANTAAGITATVVASNPAYSVTNAAITFIGPYSFTYTTVGSGLPVADGGTVTIIVPAWSATQSANQGFSPLPAGTAAGTTGRPFSLALPGQTINGLVVGPVEYWGDSTIWDTTNNRAIPANFNIDAAIQWKSS